MGLRCHEDKTRGRVTDPRQTAISLLILNHPNLDCPLVSSYHVSSCNSMIKLAYQAWLSCEQSTNWCDPCRRLVRSTVVTIMMIDSGNPCGWWRGHDPWELLDSMLFMFCTGSIALASQWALARVQCVLWKFWTCGHIDCHVCKGDWALILELCCVSDSHCLSFLWKCWTYITTNWWFSLLQTIDL